MAWIPPVVLIALLLGLLAFMRAAFKVVVVYEWELALLYVNGRFQRQLPPGRHRPFSLGRSVLVQRVPNWPQIDISPQVDVLTSDRFALRLGAAAEFQIVDARKVVEGQSQHIVRLRQALAEKLIEAASQRTLDQVIADRPTLGVLMLPGLAETLPELEITAIRLLGLQLPPETRRLLTEVERAKLEGQAALERARGEHAALRSLANAARLLKDNPDLMRLRTLQALSPTGKGATLVLGQDAITPLGRAGAAT